MRRTTKLLILLLFISAITYAQKKTSSNLAHESYLQKIAHVEALITLKQYRDARNLFELIPKRNGIEYDYLNTKLNQQESSTRIANGLYSLTINPKGDLIAIGDSDSLIHLKSSDDLSDRGVLTGHKGAVTCLEFSPDGQWLISGSRDKAVIVWDVARKEMIKELKDDSWNGIYDASLNPDATRLGVATWTYTQGHVLGIVHLFDTKTWELVLNLEPPSPHPVSAIDFSNDGNGVVYGTWGLSIHYYDFLQRNVKWALNMMNNPEYSSVTSIEVSPDNQTVLVGTKDTKVRLVNARTGKIFFEPDPYQWHNDEVNDIAFSPDGKFFASSSLDESINLGDATTGQRLGILLGHHSSVKEVFYHPINNKLYSISEDGYLNIWKLNEKQLEKINGCPDPGYGRGLFYAKTDPKGNSLALACGKKILLWDVNKKTNLEFDVATYYGIDFTGDGRLIVGEKDGKLSIWNIATQQMTKRFSAHDNYIQKVTYLDNDNVLTSAGKELKWWDVKNEKMIKSFEAGSFIYSFVHSRKHNIIIVCTSGGENMVLDPKSLEVKTKWKGTATGSTVVVSGDENKFAIGQSDGKILVYETKSNRLLAEFKDADGPIEQLIFDQSGGSLISAASRRTQNVKFWDIDTKSMSLFLHEFTDIMSVQSVGNDRRFILVDKHGRTYVLKY